MNSTIVGIDLAKNHNELAIADEHYRIVRRERLSRARFARFFANHPPCLIVMEACGSAHYWARTLRRQGHELRLLPAHHVRSYVRGNKTDRADAQALIEAARCLQIKPVPVKTVEQQFVQHLHRLREQYKATRVQRINLARGVLREAGIAVPEGAKKGLQVIREALECAENGLHHELRSYLGQVLQEIEGLREQMHQLERSLSECTKEDLVVRNLMSIPGVGLLTATAIRAAVGDVQRFPSARHFSSWLGLTAREHSSGEKRRLGRITKRGDAYLRTLLVHGARAVLSAAGRAKRAGRELDRLRSWAVATAERMPTNKAVVALANKLARVIWVTWKHHRAFDANWHSQSRTENIPSS
jgi:transposase